MARTSAGGVTELQIQNSTHSYAADAGGTDDYAITLNPAVTAYVTGQRFAFKANTANTTGATLNVNGLGAKTIVKHFNATLATNDIKAGSIVEVYYDGTNFQMVSMLSQAPSGSGDMQASTYDALGIAGQIAGRDYANSFTKSQAIKSDNDGISLAVRRNSGSQTAKVFEVQSEVNATLASFDKDGNLAAANFSGSSSGTNTGDNAVNSNYSGLVSNATHTGDVTGSTALTIANKAVTLAKMDDMATGSLIYRKTAGAGAPEVQTLATLKTDLGLTGTNSGDQDLSGLVTKATYDAHTVLYATTDNTPVALTVSEQTVVGRATGGNIAAIAIDSDLSSVSANDDTIPSAKATKAMGDLKLPLAGGTMSGDITLGENTSIALDPAGSADGKYSGITVTGTAGYTVGSGAFGDIVTLDKDDSRWEKVDISVAAAATGDARGVLGVMLTDAPTDGNACKILLHGIVRADANFPALTIGAEVYASTTGDVVVAQPTTTDYVIRQVGYALTADELYFNPTGTWTTHT